VARKMRGIALARANQLKQGLDEYVRAISDESRSGVPDAVKSLLGTKGASAIDKVTFELQQTINNHPDEYVPKLRLGQLYQYTNQLSEAKSQLLDARRLQPNNPEVLRTLAVVQKELGEDNQAMSNFKISVNLETKQEKEKEKSKEN
jgi:tetratricopeptide (TPR) repeat protein